MTNYTPDTHTQFDPAAEQAARLREELAALRAKCDTDLVPSQYLEWAVNTAERLWARAQTAEQDAARLRGERDAYVALAKAYTDARQAISDHVGEFLDECELCVGGVLCDAIAPADVIRLTARRELMRLSHGLTDAATALAALERVSGAALATSGAVDGGQGESVPENATGRPQAGATA